MEGRRFWLFAVVTVVAANAAVAQEPDDLREQWREVLQFGIDSQVESILEQIEQSGDETLDDLIARRFARTRSDELRAAIIEHMTARESIALAEPVRELLLAGETLDNDLLRVSSAYLSRVVGDTSDELLARYAEIAEDANLLASTVAIDAIGRAGTAAAVETLLALYQRLTGSDQRGAVLRALGQAGDERAIPLLTSIAEDEFAESALRHYATESLGRIGSPESLPLLTDLLAADDALLRAYATFALGFYEGEEAGLLLEEALLDSFWRVRVSAIEALAQQGRRAAVPAIAFKARRDPERPVREEAVRALAVLATDEGQEVLVDLVRSERTGQGERILALEELARAAADDRADREAVARLMAEIAAEEWDTEGSRLLDAVGRMVSEHAHPAYESIYVRLLGHPNFIVRIYGIRGIAAAGLRGRAESLEEIARANATGLLRRTAITGLEQLGVEFVEEPDESAADAGDDDGTESAPGDSPATESEDARRSDGAAADEPDDERWE